MSKLDTREVRDTLRNQIIGIERNRAEISRLEQDLANLADHQSPQAAFLRAVRTRLSGEITCADRLVAQIQQLKVFAHSHASPERIDLLTGTRPSKAAQELRAGDRWVNMDGEWEVTEIVQRDAEPEEAARDGIVEEFICQCPR